MLVNNFPKVSFIIPVYNHQNYLIQTLDSVLLDTYPNKELIIINDGSTDLSHMLIELWATKNKPNIDVLYKNRENKGLAITLNELISLSTGKYIVPLASDDYLINDMTLLRVRTLEKSPNKLMLINDAIVVDSNNNLICSSANFEFYKGKKKYLTSSRGIMHEIVFNWFCAGPICMIDKRLYEKIGYYNTKLLVEDWDFYLRASANKQILFSDISVAAYRIHKQNTHSSLSKKINIYLSIATTAKSNISYFHFPLNMILYCKYLKIKISIFMLIILSFIKNRMTSLFNE